MSKILFLDLDGTVRKSKSGATFINDPYDQELIPGVEDAIARHEGWQIFGITNQGGVGAGYKTLENCILEQQETLRLLPRPKMFRIYFCPDHGATFWGVAPESAQEISTNRITSNFRKPGTGMIEYVMLCSPKMEECLFVGDRTEDQEAAKNANIPFMWAEDWRNGK
jgi:D-glycero-D-manno-heptose 1,7-bisphosphate phosphatase